MNAVVNDFRSDTVTRPSAQMRQVMSAAEVGDDVYGEDLLTAQLESELAARMGKEAGLFVPSGTQSNLLALMSHCARGDEYIAGQDAHCYQFEAGGGAVLGSIQPQPVPNQPDGTLAIADIEAVIKVDDIHFARSKLLALENTIGGRVLPEGYVQKAVAVARDHGLCTHLDGARIFNAAVAQGVAVRQLAEPFDSVSVCLSKGLGAPIGSVLVGSEALIGKARRLRKMVGGGMRQTGILAAAGLYALEHNVDRLAEDHANAAALAAGLAKFDALTIVMAETNMVWVEANPSIAKDFAKFLRDHKILVHGRYDGGRQRWVTHLDVDAAAVEQALHVVGQFFNYA